MQGWPIIGQLQIGQKIQAIMCAGENYHANHHAFPGSARFDLEPHEIDIGFRTLKMMEKVGLVWNIKERRDLPARKELIDVRTSTIVTSPDQQPPNVSSTSSNLWDRFVRHPVDDSVAISELAYHAESETCRVYFRKARCWYEYHGMVPQQYVDLQNGEGCGGSVGAHFNKYVRKNFPFEKVVIK